MSAPLPRRDREARQTPDWRRRYASYACPPAEDGVRDPLARCRQQDGPSTYSLPTTALYRHAADLIRRGWSEAEVHQRLKLRAVPAA